MDDDEVMRLYDILYREQYKLASIELKYEKKDADLAQRYSEVISEYQGLRSLARKYPKNFYDLYVELQDTILDLYLRSYRGERGTIAYENLLSEALDDSEVFYRKNRSRKSRLVSMRLLTGAFKLNKEQIDEALALFESAYRLDRDTSAPYLARGYNSLAYRFAYDEDYASALETIDKAIRLQPSEANYYDSKGEILLMMDDWDGALEMWDKVLEVDPEFLSRYKNGTDFYHQLTRMGLIE
jgi:tetratricopeptide (TPR) repeat protein